MNTFNTFWKQITANNAKHDSSVYLLFDLLKGREPKGSSFTPITNKVKLANGQTEWQGLEQAKRHLRVRLQTLKNMKPESLSPSAEIATLKLMLEHSGKTIEEIIAKM